MPLDPTIGGPDANSLLSVPRADELAADHPYAEAWGTYSDPRKEQLLIRATSLFASELCFEGVATTETQALPFPRAGLVNRNGYLVPSDSIPLAVEWAVFELALSLGEGDTTKESDVAVQGLTRLKAGPVELGFKQTIAYKPIPQHVRSYIPSSWLCVEESLDWVFEAV